MTRACASRARSRSRSKCGLSRLRTAVPPGSSPAKISAFASAISSTDGEEFQVHRLDRGDDRHVRAHQLRQRRDLAGVVHADLEHAVARVGRHARQRQRHAPVVVEGLFGGVRRRRARDRQQRSISLVPVLPTLPVTATMRASLRARAARRDAAQALERVVDAQQRAVARDALVVRRDQRRGGAACGTPRRRSRGRRARRFRATNTSPGCSVRVSMEKPVMGASGAPSAAALGGRHQIVPRPQRLGHAISRSPSAWRTSSWSENGSTLSPTIWPVSWPLPATTAHRPRPAWRRRRGSPRRGRRSRARRARPARISARMASGPLGARIVVGDDDDVGILDRDRAHDRPLALVAVAAAAEDADELAGGERAQRIERGGQRFGLVRVVDDDEAAARLADDLQPALDALQALQRRQHAAGGLAGGDGETGGDAARSTPGSRRAAAGGCRSTRPSCATDRRCAKPSRTSAFELQSLRRRGRRSGRGGRRSARAATTSRRLARHRR